jgi:hypothetical protein
MLLATVPAACIAGLLLYGFQDRAGRDGASRWSSGSPLAWQWFVLVVGLAVPTTLLLVRARRPGHWVAAVCGLALAVAGCFLSLLVFVALTVD